MNNEMTDIINLLESLRLGHYGCEEDRYYSCPKHEDGCANDFAEEDCNCGADWHNTVLDVIISRLKGVGLC